MGRIDNLALNFERHLSVPWQQSVTAAQRVMLCIYHKEDERQLRARIGEFEIKTKETGHDWARVDFTEVFSRWLAGDEYRDAYFEMPEDLDMKIEGEFKPHVADTLRSAVSSAGENTVTAVTGIASLYGFVQISDLIHKVENDVKGRMVVFFPGSKEGSNYRLLDARDGWNYLAHSITDHPSGGIA